MVLRRLIWPASIALLATGCQPAPKHDDRVERDTPAKVAKADPSDSIARPTSIPEIRSAYAAIVLKLQRGQLDSTVVSYNCADERQGKISYFSAGGHVVFVRHNYQEYSHYEAIDEYFLAHDSLFFSARKDVSWNFVDGEAAEGTTEDHVTEQRTYLVNGKPIQCLEKKYTVRSDEKGKTDPAAVANKAKPCGTVRPLIRKFKLLMAYRKRAKGCLDE